MASKINYDDKVSLTTSELPRANKCTDEDLNEIKNVVNENADILDETQSNVLKQAEEDFTNKVTFNESGYSSAHTQFIKKGNMGFITYQGANTTHTANDIIAVVPEGYRPEKSQIYAVCTVGTNAFGILHINSNGELILSGLSQSVSGRIYCNFSYYIG